MIVKHFNEILEKPKRITNELNALLVIKSIAVLGKTFGTFREKADKLDNFYKFTEHLFNIGGATRDDLVLSPEDFKTFFESCNIKVIVMEEKIDGANLGFSMERLNVRIDPIISTASIIFNLNSSEITFIKRRIFRKGIKDGRILYDE